MLAKLLPEKLNLLRVLCLATGALTRLVRTRFLLYYSQDNEISLA